MDRLSTIPVRELVQFNSKIQLRTLKVLKVKVKKFSLDLCLTVFLSFQLSAVRFGRVPKREKAKILAAMQSSRIKTMENRVMAEMADDSKIIETIVRAHFDTCDYTANKIEPFIQKAKSDQNLTQCSGMVSTFF